MSSVSKQNPVRLPEKMDPVNNLIKEIFPGRPFMVIVWEPNGADRSFVQMHTNCDLEECSSLLKDSALHIEENIVLKNTPVRHGNACLPAVLSVGLLEAILDNGIYADLLSWLWAPSISALMS
jgi:hypothetical protein